MNLQSLGHAAATFQQCPAYLRKALDIIEKKPHLTLNGIDYFESSDIVEALGFITKVALKRAIEEATEGVENV
jgi:hypothetical protein